eukprot:1157785-Pelagomonas_calceolata.AAC.11
MENRGWGPLDGLHTGKRDTWLDGWLTTHQIPIGLVAHSLDCWWEIAVCVSVNCWVFPSCKLAAVQRRFKFYFYPVVFF